MKRICIILSFVLFIFLSSCTSNGGVTHTYGDWKYKINTKTKEVMLIGFSEEGKKKETIVLPTIIKGKRVTTIGYLKDYIIDDGDGVWTADFRGATYKKIYLHSLIESPMISSGHGLFSEIPPDFNIFYGRYFKADIMLTKENNYSKCFIPFICKDGYEDRAHSHYNSANVVYYMNDDTNSTFFCDDCDGTKVNVIPPDPYRNGYKFIGWYKEKEGINEFDFDKEFIGNKEYDNDNKYILNETSIYAKWEKI